MTATAFASSGVSTDPLFDLLHPQRLTAVVDIGANPIDGDPPYKAMLGKRLCTVTGFEPQADALTALTTRKGDLEVYLPYVMGDGSDGKLHITYAPGMTSLFEPNPAVLNCFSGFPQWGKVLNTLAVSTRRLDDLPETAVLDFLKIDVQGSELAVFKGGRERLKRVVAVQTEVSLVPFYKGQPVLGDIDLALREAGLIPHALVAINKRMILPLFNKTNPHAGMNQVIEADIVYIRDFTNADTMDEEQLKHLALIAHHCYGSYDLALHCLHRLFQRNAVTPDAVDRYIGAMNTGYAKPGAVV